MLGEASTSPLWFSRALLLSLLRSLIPFADKSRVPLARKKVSAASEWVDDGVAELVISTGEKVKELPVLMVSVTESVSGPDASTQPAGVGGTGPNEVPIWGGCRPFGRIACPDICLGNMSTLALAL